MLRFTRFTRALWAFRDSILIPSKIVVASYAFPSDSGRVFLSRWGTLTRVLAKLVNYVAKKYPAYRDQGVCLLTADSPATHALLKHLPVWGIARRFVVRLRVIGSVSGKNLCGCMSWFRLHYRLSISALLYSGQR